VHALPFAAINIKENTALGDAKDFFFHSTFNDTVSNSDYMSQGCPTFLAKYHNHCCGLVHRTHNLQM
jgi:hypothetical protein